MQNWKRQWRLKTYVNGKCSRVRVVRITEKCNNNCVFCTVPAGWKHKHHMPSEKVKKIIDRSRTCDTLEFGGAEPTIHPDFFELVEYASAKKLNISITTNARLFCYEKYAARLGKIGNVSIKSSLHSPKPSVHDSITRAEGSYKQAVQGFANLSRHKVPVAVNIVVNSLNIGDLRGFVKTVADKGGKSVYFSCMILCADELDKKLFVPFSELRKAIPDAVAYARKLGLRPIIEKFPLCVAPEMQGFFMAEPALSRHYRKPSSCEGCAAYDRCAGFHSTYFNKDLKLDIVPFAENANEDH